MSLTTSSNENKVANTEADNIEEIYNKIKNQKEDLKTLKSELKVIVSNKNQINASIKDIEEKLFEDIRTDKPVDEIIKQKEELKKLISELTDIVSNEQNKNDSIKDIENNLLMIFKKNKFKPATSPNTSSDINTKKIQSDKLIKDVEAVINYNDIIEYLNEKCNQEDKLQNNPIYLESLNNDKFYI